MLTSIRHLYGNKLGASDGEIGHLKDFYFDDQSWTVRYLVADTGSWLPGRRVLIPPHACGGFDQAGKMLRVNLTRRQIESSPSIESHKPVSRQYEEEYHRYFGWPYYWEGDALPGFSGVPLVAAPTSPEGTQSKQDNPHLRSTQAVNGYHLSARGENLGHVCDFMMDHQTWTIGQLVFKIGHRLSGREVRLATSAIERISYDESTVFVNLTREAIEQNPPHPLAAAG